MKDTHLKQVCLGLVVYNDWRNALELLKSLNEIGILRGLGELIIVDNCSSENYGAEFGEFLKNFSARMIANFENNMGRARALIVEQASCPLLLFLDADTRPSGDWANALSIAKNLLDQNPDWAGIGGANVCAEESVFTEALRAALDHPFVNGRSSQLGAVDKLTDVQHLSTCNVLYLVEHVRSAGNFSCGFDRTGEDLELSCRIIKSKKKLKMLPGFEVRHLYPESNFLLAKKFSKWGRAQFPVFFKHPRQMRSLHFKLFLIGSFSCFAFFLPQIFFKAALFSELLFFISLNISYRLKWRAFVFAHFIWFFYSLGIFFGALTAFSYTTERNYD